MKVRLGIVGCGEVTQIIHLPALAQLEDKFEVVALCDVSPAVLEGVGRQLPLARQYTTSEALIDHPSVDAVLVANPSAYHAATTVLSLDSGKHVFVEKPLAMNLAEADDMAAAQSRSGKTVQVGYMRRYSGAFLEAVDIVRACRGQVRFARVQDIIGANRLIVDDTSVVVRQTGLLPGMADELKAANARGIAPVVSSGDPALSVAYNLLLGLGSHDISAMRELLGMPRRVLHATQRQGGRHITASFDYGCFVCEFTTGVDTLPRFDAFLEVFVGDRVIRVDYDTPYIRNLPARLTLTEPHGSAGVKKSVSFPQRLDAFVVEWSAFHKHIVNGTSPKTSIADSRLDLEIFAEMVSILDVHADQEKLRVAG